MKQVIVITDLGGGDGGKGGVVHGLCHHHNAHTVIKVGGAQGSHGVHTRNGESFNFSHFGCGTFEGVKTHISHMMLVEPYGLLHEANSLKYEFAIHNIFDLITIEENVLCITPFHRIKSQLRELARKKKQKGTVGIGAGEAQLDSEESVTYAVYIKDIQDENILRKKLMDIQKKTRVELNALISNPKSFWKKDQGTVDELLELLNDDDFINRIIGFFTQMYTSVHIVDNQYMFKEILSKEGTVIVESSHGILTDRYYGFHPYISRLRTIPQRIIDYIKSGNYTGDIKLLGVTRAYAIRHGAGPLATESPGLTNILLPGSNKDENRFQGKVRVGPLDFVSLRYSIDVCGGSNMFDGIAITWFDQIEKNGKWEYCDAYLYKDDPRKIYCLPNHDDSIKIPQQEYQERLGKVLFKMRPVLTEIDISSLSRDEIIKNCCELVFKKLCIPVQMISFGPTESHKVWIDKK